MKQYLFIFLCSLQCLWLPHSGGQTSAQVRPSDSKFSSMDFSHPHQALQEGKYDEAIIELQRLSSSQPGVTGAARELGMAYYKKADYVHAVDAFKLALQQDSEDHESIQMLGISYYMTGRAAEAIPLLEKIQTWYPRAN